ncbi:MAG: DMT family transporter [Bacteroidales bacterium]
MENKITGHLTSFLAVLFFSLNIPATTYIFDGWLDASAYTFIRTSGGFLICWLISLGIKNQKLDWAKDWLTILLGGILGLALFFFLYGYGIGETSPIDAAIILTLSPIIVLVLSAFIFKEKITPLKAVGILLALSGALLIILLQGKRGKETEMLGNILVFVAAFIYSIYLIFTRDVSRKYNPVNLLRWMFLSAFLVSLPVGLPDLLHSNLVRNYQITPLLVTLYIAIFPSALAYVLIPVSLKSLSSTIVSMYIYLIPIIATIASVILGQAVLRWDEPVAIILVIAGVYLANLKKKTPAG